ncbi:MAG: hypothetical protein CMF70_10540 [Magnetovibrio sp.]|nr:hypothetical protein [Magnetovibrio sp.]
MKIATNLLKLSLVIGCTLSALQPSQSQTSPLQELKAIEQNIARGIKNRSSLSKRKEALEEEAKKLRHKLVSTVSAIRKNQKQIKLARRDLEKLNYSQQNSLLELESDRNRFEYLFVALYRLAKIPPEASIALPSSPIDSVRSSLLLRTSLGHIKERANFLANTLKTLSKRKEEIAHKKNKIKLLLSSLDKQKRHFSALLSRKEILKRRTDSRIFQENERLSLLAKKAKTLKDLLKELTSKKRFTVSKNTKKSRKRNATWSKVQPVAAAKGKFLFPVVGKLTSRFGQKNNSGIIQKGITIETEPRSPVIATYHGRVVFTGEFRGYGLLLIIEHGDGYHSLLAGMEKITVDPGATLTIGDPVGIMAKLNSKKPSLYAEFRKNGQPINLVPWLISGSRDKEEVEG